MENMINPTEVVATLINFLIFFLFYKFFFHKKVSAIIEKRQNFITENMEKIKDEQEKAEKYRKDNEEFLQATKEEAKEIVEFYKEKGEKLHDEMVIEAQTESKSIVERGKLELERERIKVEAEVKNEAIDLAILLAEKSLEKAIDEKEHRRLIEQFITKVGI